MPLLALGEETILISILALVQLIRLKILETKAIK